MGVLLDFSVWFLIEWLPGLWPWRRVPDLTGQEHDAAELLLYSIPFEVETDGARGGRVAFQHPPAGTRLRANRTVTITTQ